MRALMGSAISMGGVVAVLMRWLWIRSPALAWKVQARIANPFYALFLQKLVPGPCPGSRFGMSHDAAAAVRSMPSTDPLALFRLRDGLYAVDLVGAAIAGFDFYSALGRSPGTLESICSGQGLHPRPADVLLSLSASLGLVERDGMEWRLSTLGREFLDGGSEWCLGPYFTSLKNRPVCQDLIEVLRTGRPTSFGSFKDAKAWAQAMEGEAFARQFTAAMDVRGRYLAPVMARRAPLGGRRKLLDIAGGSGIYACALVEANPGLQAVVWEKRPVDRIVESAVRDRGYGGSVGVAVGDMFCDPVPEGCDVHLYSNVLHDWDVLQVKALLARSWESLPSGGLLLIHDVHLNEHKTGPFPAAAYSALLMTITEGRCYGVGELREWMGALGFSKFEYIDTAADRSVISAVKT